MLIFQVLAEMDDAELQRLPQNLQDEARRARANMAHYDNNLLRYGDFIFRKRTNGALGK